MYVMVSNSIDCFTDFYCFVTLLLLHDVKLICQLIYVSDSFIWVSVLFLNDTNGCLAPGEQARCDFFKQQSSRVIISRCCVYILSQNNTS